MTSLVSAIPHRRLSQLGCCVAIFLAIFAARPAVAAEDGFAGLTAQWAVAWGAADLDAVMSLYAADPVFQPTSTERWTGADTIRQHFAAALSKYRGELHMHSQRVAASGDLAIDSGTYDETVKPVSGKGKPKNLHGGYLFVFQRAAGGDWKILEQVWTEYGAERL